MVSQIYKTLIHLCMHRPLIPSFLFFYVSAQIFIPSNLGVPLYVRKKEHLQQNRLHFFSWVWFNRIRKIERTINLTHVKLHKISQYYKQDLFLRCLFSSAFLCSCALCSPCCDLCVQEENSKPLIFMITNQSPTLFISSIPPFEIPLKIAPS